MKAIKIFVFVFSLLALSDAVCAQNKRAQKQIDFYYLLKWKDSINLDTKNEVLALWKTIPSKIKGCEKVDVIDLSMSTDSFNTVIIMVFNTEEALTIWGKHPDHIRLGEIGLPLLSGLSEFNYRK